MALYKTLVRKVSIPPDKKTKQKDYQKQGKLAIIDQGQKLIGGYSDNVENRLICELPVIVFGDHSRVVKYITFPFGAGADGIKVLEPKEAILPKYLYYGTQYLVLRLRGRGYARHYQFIEKKELSVVSIPEQARIVAHIEELFSQLDASVNELEMAKKRLKGYRQAVVTAAYPTLTAENTCCLSELAEISGGITKGRKFEGSETVFLPYLRVANVQNGYLDLAEVKQIQLKKSEIEQYLLRFGDVLYTEGGDRDKLGRGTIWRNEIEKCVHQNHVFKARIDTEKALPLYVAYWSMATPARNYFYTKGKQSVNLASINKTVLSMLPIPLIPIEQQQKIVVEIESKLSICDSIEKTVDTALQQAEALRQSILKKAFEGGF